MKYNDLDFICTLDREYLDKLSEEYGIDWGEIEFEFEDWTNGILYGLLYEIACQEVENEKDREKILDRIYCNCLDSGYDIDSEELETQQAKDFINNF